MKICIIGAPSTGKSVFARSLSAEMAKRGLSCELLQEFATQYIKLSGAPTYAWEQLVISIGQYLSEQKSARDHVVTDAAAFVTYIYAQRILPQSTPASEWPKYRQLLDILRILARTSAESYDLIFLLTHVFPPQPSSLRLAEHFSQAVCKEINSDIEEYLRSERFPYHRLQANSRTALENAMQIIQQRLLIEEP